MRNRLLADHCGLSAAEVAHFLGNGKTLLDAAECSLGRAATACVASTTANRTRRNSLAISNSIADPERPIARDALTSQEFTGRRFRFRSRNVAKLAAGVLFVLGLTAVWNLTPLADQLTPAAIEAALTSVAASPWAPAYVLGAFLGGGLVAFPVVLLIAGTAAAFGPILGFAYAAIGSLASALLTYVHWSLARPPATSEHSGTETEPHTQSDLPQWDRRGRRRSPCAHRTFHSRQHGRRRLPHTHRRLPRRHRAWSPARSSRHVGFGAPDLSLHHQPECSRPCAPGGGRFALAGSDHRRASPCHASAECRALTEARSSTVRVMTWNIHGGVGPDRRTTLLVSLRLSSERIPISSRSRKSIRG